jgi:diguanylate cyclase (GGDEF)-like protein/PAS domain S-box-containing protein
MENNSVILVVDDQPKNIELIEAFLVPRGYEIVKAASGEEALEKLDNGRIDLVLLDVMMPRVSGLEVLRKIRSVEKTRLLPVIMITALNGIEDRIQALEAGCDDFISKPFNKQELLVRVESLLKIKALHEEVNEAREYAESIINTVREPLISLDKDLRVVTVSRSFCEVFKVKPEETVGHLIYNLGNRQWDIPKLRQLLETILPQETSFDNYEVEHDFAGIGSRVMLLNARQIKRGMGKERIILLAIEDITERKQAEEKIRQLAYYDTLTGLPNRKLFSDRLAVALAHAERNKQEVGVAMIDLDNFKSVNDTLGHDAGDLLLKAAAERLSSALRKEDTVARFGGDEFVLVLPDFNVIEDSEKVVQQIVDKFCKPFYINAKQLIVTTSIGIAVYPNDGADEGTLLKNADIAMYQAKQAGRARYRLCNKD